MQKRLPGLAFFSRSICTVCFLAGAVIGCQQSMETAVSKSQVSIFYGETSPTLYPSLAPEQQNAVVSLCLSFYPACYCTGALISPRIVLTAAHCIDVDGAVTPPEQVKILVGPDNSNPVARLDVFAQDYLTAEGPDERDVGVLLLSGPFTGATPLPLATTGFADLQGQQVQAVGYGRTENSDQVINTTRYWTTLPVEGVAPSVIAVDGEGVTGLGKGDSGGPLLYDFGSGVSVAGVASRGGNVGLGLYASMEEYGAWVRAFVEEHDGTSCRDACSDAQCGERGGCRCGSCERGSTCQDNSCVPLQPGSGGVCVNWMPSMEQCASSADCDGTQVCYEFSDGSATCGDVCGPEPCRQGDADSMCYPVEFGEYTSFFCAVRDPEPCSEEGAACTTEDGQTGMCFQMFAGMPIACNAFCEPVATCPEGRGCLPHNMDCDQACDGVQCGLVESCDCGSCDRGSCEGNQCSECQPRCRDRECGTDGCGGSCGSCDEGSTCVEGACAAEHPFAGCRQFAPRGASGIALLVVLLALLPFRRRASTQ